jgi:FtsZ-binding cell division protein ZapB
MTHSNTEQPKNSITLMNGAVLECFPKESHQDDFVPDKMKLDATGTYLSLGNKPCKPLPRTTEDVKQQKKLFTDNAFYLLAHSERIMHDSRMFLTPVAVQTQGSHTPTLGIYLEWWNECSIALRTDKDGNRSLVYSLAGSPMTGGNSCAEVYEDGRTESVQVSSFMSHLRTFGAINARYDEAKHIYQAYTLEQVLEILHAEDGDGWDYSSVIKERFMQAEINELKKKVERLTKESKKWYSMYEDTYMKYKDAEISEAFSTFQSFREECEAQINSIKMRKRALKAELKSGRMDNIIYQRTLMPLNKQISNLEFNISFKEDELFNKYLSEGISYYAIENYMNKKNNIEK